MILAESCLNVSSISMILIWQSMLERMNTSIRNICELWLYLQHVSSSNHFSMAGSAEKCDCIHPGPSDNNDYSSEVLLLLWRMLKVWRHLEVSFQLEPWMCRNCDVFFQQKTSQQTVPDWCRTESSGLVPDCRKGSGLEVVHADMLSTKKCLLLVPDWCF